MTWDKLKTKAEELGYDSDLVKDRLIHSYYESSAGKHSFDPGDNLKTKQAMTQLTLWEIAKCNEHPARNHDANSCIVVIATLTQLGLRIGGELVNNILDDVKKEKVESSLNNMPPRIRALYVGILANENELKYKESFNSQLNNLEQKLGLEGLSKVPYEDLFPGVLNYAGTFTRELSNLDLGVVDIKDHNVKGWFFVDALRTVPEVCTLLSKLSKQDPSYFISLEKNIIESNPELFGKFILLKKLENYGELTYNDINGGDIPKGFDSDKFLEELVKEKILSKKPSRSDEGKIIDILLPDKSLSLAKEIQQKMVLWWNETNLKSDKDISKEEVKIQTTLKTLEEDHSNKLPIQPKLTRTITVESKIPNIGVTSAKLGKILVGFEVKTGNEVYMNPHHTVITGMTQLSGKTTAMEAMVDRSNATAISFITKRGESGFRGQREITPYFREQKKGDLIDWQYVSSILEATMKEKMRIERSFIIKACKGARSLQDVYNNIKVLKAETRGGLAESIYENLAAYFEIILPEMEKRIFADALDLRPGFNVMNLVDMPDEMQQLVIESVISYILRKLENVIVVLPEAHKFIPQSRNTPVKLTAQRFIREGAAIGNYLWIDTQETTSVDKSLLKQCSNWIMGFQQEKNEVESVRENLGKRFITEEDIMTLTLGHFVVSLQQQKHRVYILPSGIEPELGKAVALGKASVEDVKKILDKRRK